MGDLYWLASLAVIAGAIWAYARYWYYRPSGMPEILTASYSYQTLEYMDWYARHKAEDPDEYEIPTYRIASYIAGRQLGWRQRNDIISYMKRMGWVYEDTEGGTQYYAINRVGKQELETADGLGGAVEEAAQMLHNQGLSGDQAKATAAAVIAAAFRVHARSASSENRKREEASANESKKLQGRAIRTKLIAQ